MFVYLIAADQLCDPITDILLPTSKHTWNGQSLSVRKKLCVPFLLCWSFSLSLNLFYYLRYSFFCFLLNVFNIQYALNIVSSTSVLSLIFLHTSYHLCLQEVPTFQVIVIFHYCHPLPSFTFYSPSIYPFHFLKITLHWYLYIITISRYSLLCTFTCMDWSLKQAYDYWQNQTV